MKLLFEILQNNGKIKSEIIFSNLSESDSFKIEQLLIFILKRRIEYLCTHKVKGKRKRYLRKFGGKLMNKSIGGESTGKKVVNEFANPSLIINNYPDIETIIEKSDFLYKLKNKIFSNFTEIENYSTILNYLLSQKKILKKR
ncbi:hypothetical protein N8270_03855 [Polaribacter sp.]|nr:hypothetical protein [Polaribacter sp.]